MANLKDTVETMDAVVGSDPVAMPVNEDVVEALAADGAEARKGRAELRQAAQAFVDFGAAKAKDAIVARASVDGRLTAMHWKVLAHYLRCVSGRRGISYPNVDTIAVLADVDRKTVYNARGDLVRWRYLQKADGRSKGEADLPNGTVVMVTPADMDWPALYAATRSNDELVALKARMKGDRGGERRRTEVAEVHSSGEGEDTARNQGSTTARSEGTISEVLPSAREVHCPQPGKCAPSTLYYSVGTTEENQEGKGTASTTTTAGASLDQVPSAMPVEAPTDLLGGRGPIPGITFPTAVIEVMESGRAAASVSALVDAVKSQMKAGTPVDWIESAMRKAVGDACADAGDEEPTPSALIRKVLRFVERSAAENVPAGSPASRPVAPGQPPRKMTPDEHARDLLRGMGSTKFGPTPDQRPRKLTPDEEMAEWLRRNGGTKT